MSVADVLGDIGKVAGAVGQRTAEVVSGQAPEIDAEKRKSAEKAEDEQIAAKASILENNLAMGQKYGTLTPQQQQQYIDQITGLYSHPRHAGTLMEKLRKAIHPNGAVAQGPQAPLANPIPEGGTQQADTDAAMAKESQKLADAMAEIDRRYADAAKNQGNRKSTAKSPPLTGDKLPLDAVGANGQPITDADRTAGKSFVEWNGSWWPVAKPKPVFKTVKGHSVLVDAQSGAILRDLGPTGTAKVTSRQTLQPGDDGQMHLVTLTSVTTPEGATIEVQPDEQKGDAESQSGTEGKQSAPKTGAKTVSPGSILPKTGARPAAKPSGSSGPVVPGLSTLARSKNPMYKADVATYKKLDDDAKAKHEAFVNADGLLKDPKRTTDLELVYAWVRGNVQGAGRMTNTEIQQTATAGSWGMRVQNMIAQAQQGRFAPEMEQQFLRDIQRSADTAQKEADAMKAQLGDAANPQPQSKGRRSIQAAMNLPFNKGKSRDAVIADLKQHGYEPVEP